MPRVVMLGPAGAGKGTQGKRLAETWGVPHVASGDLLRRIIETEDGDLAHEARVINEGRMVADETVWKIVRREIENAPGFVLDGYPRNLPQAETLDAFLSGRGERLDAVILLVLDQTEIIERLSGRLTCPNCGETYHIKKQPPRVPGICDRCGHALVVREDDTPESIRTRLALFSDRIGPLIGYYRAAGVLREVDAKGTEDAVFERCLRAIEEN